jgi:hypothetical protein
VTPPPINVIASCESSGNSALALTATITPAMTANIPCTTNRAHFMAQHNPEASNGQPKGRTTYGPMHAISCPVELPPAARTINASGSARLEYCLRRFLPHVRI